MLIRIVKMRFQPDKIAVFQKIFAEVKQKIRQFAGCRHLELWQDQKDTCIFFTHSHWENEAALNNYRQSDFFRTTWSKTKVLFIEKPQAWSFQDKTHSENDKETNTFKSDYQVLNLQDYQILVGNCLTFLDSFLAERNYSQLFVLVDENTQRNCLSYLLEKNSNLSDAKIIEIESGEIHKNLITCQEIWTQLLNNNADRNVLLINLGGGVIGDMGGFCASCYKRGVDFIQIPTTLLAQVDASIGGKLGVDFQHVKNIIGAFTNPELVLIDPHFLQTLPKRQLLNGFAEVLKHGLIADAKYLTNLLQIDLAYPMTIDWNKIIFHSLKIKKRIVTADPFEKGLRKILNFGHTIGHAIESYSLAHDKNSLLHGEAIVLGMIAELRLSMQKLGFPVADYIRLKNYFQRYYPSYSIKLKQKNQLMSYLKNDKKNIANQLNFTLLRNIGEAQYNQIVAPEEVDFCMEEQ